MRTKSFETEVEVDGKPVEVTVEYTFSPATPDVFYLRNGDPGYPGDPAGADIEVVYRTDDKAKTDLSKKLSEETFERLIEQACNAGEEALNDDYDDAMERKADEAREREWDR